MKLSLNNFLYGIKQIVTGDNTVDGGILRDVSLTPTSIATTGTRATAENLVPADAIVLDAAGEDAIVNFTIPREYDEDLDHLRVVLLVAYVSGTSIPVGASAVSKGSPTEVYADLATFVAPTATTIDTAFSIGEVVADLSSLGHERHDNLSVNFAAGTPVGVGIANVIGARVEFRSTVVSFDEEDASANCLR